MAASTRARTVKPDQIGADAVDLARSVAEEAAGTLGVGEHLGIEADADRVVSHFFACPHAGYAGWRWSVTLVRASRAKTPTVNEVVLLPGDTALMAEHWVPVGRADPAGRRDGRSADADRARGSAAGAGLHRRRAGRRHRSGRGE